MTNNKLFLFIFFLKTLFIFSQTENHNDSAFFSSVLKSSSKYSSHLNLKKASYHFSLKNWDSTLIYTQKQLSIKNQNQEIKNYCYLYRGISFNRKEVYKEALSQFQLISNDFIFSNRVKFYIGIVSIKLKKFENSLSYFKELESKEELTYIYKSDISNNIGLCYLFLKNYNEAEKYLKESYQNEKDTLQLVKKYANIGNLYYIRYKDDIAIPYFEKAYNLAKKLKIDTIGLSFSEINEKKRKIFKRKKITVRNMAIIEENRKNLQKALLYRKEMERWNDSLNDQNQIYTVAQKEKEFAVKEKQNEVDILQVQNELKETQRNVLFYSALGLFVLLGVSLYFYREKVKRNKIIANQKENLDALNATKDKLFSIVSHDLRSSVNALKTSNGSLVKNLDSNNLSALRNLLQKNSAIVNGAYGLLDNLLNWALLQTNQGYFSISSLRLFFITEQVSYNYQPLLLEKELSLENTVSKKDIVFADQESLKIVLRNLLDNAIKFSKPNGSIKIYSQNSSDDFCDLIIEDTGLGMSEATRLELLKDTALLHKKEHEDVIGTGLGLQLCKSMIRKNNGKFDIESELGKGTKMIVSLPKNPSNE